MKFLTLLPVLIAAGLPALAQDAVRDDLSPKDRLRVEAVTRPTGDFTKAENFERMQGGAGTTPKVGDANALSQPSANLDFEDQQRFALGNGIFRKDWVTSPSSTLASDGLGPLFNARSCQGCHIKDGRGHAPSSLGGEAISMLVRVSVPPDADQEAAIRAGKLFAAPHPVYGVQIQDNAAAGLAPEAKPRIDYTNEPVLLSGGETVTLRRPRLSLVNPGYGPLPENMMMSARIAPPMAGMGLIEAIHDSDILAHADPDDRDGDGISGRPNMVGDGKGNLVIGRFGWKAIQPTIDTQTAHAFLGDMGLSTPLLPFGFGECMEAQTNCRAMPDGVQPQLGATEVPGDLFELVNFYSRNLAAPVRRDEGDATVLKGKQAFYAAGCAACHVPKFVTSRNAAHPAQRFQLIWPYGDFLLHDMGEDLADHRPEANASGSEWRTAPLWGIGLARQVSAEAGYLHDGRARTLTEAILWHGGEAAKARDRFRDLPKEERDALVRFLESL